MSWLVAEAVRCLRAIDVLEAPEIKETVKGVGTLIALIFSLTLEDAQSR